MSRPYEGFLLGQTDLARDTLLYLSDHSLKAFFQRATENSANLSKENCHRFSRWLRPLVAEEMLKRHSVQEWKGIEAKFEPLRG